MIQTEAEGRVRAISYVIASFRLAPSHVITYDLSISYVRT
jgi:hypothetical protein